MLPRLPHERMRLPRSRDAGPQMVTIAEVATETASQMLGSPVSAVPDSSPRERDFIVTGRGFAVRRDEGTRSVGPIPIDIPDLCGVRTNAELRFLLPGGSLASS